MTNPYSEVVIVLAAVDNHSSDDDYPLQPNLSKQAAVAVAADIDQEFHRSSAYDVVGWVYHHHH